MTIPHLDWKRLGLLTKGQTRAKYGHWVVPAWAPAPDGGMYWILPDDMSVYDPSRYDPNDPSRCTWQAWVLYPDERPPVQLVRNDRSGESVYNAVIEHKNAWYAHRQDDIE